MSKLWAVTAAMLTCLATSGMPVVAQAEAEPAAGLPLVVTGNWACTVLDRGTRGTSDGLVMGATGARDQTLDCAWTMSDPRVSGSVKTTFNDDCFSTPDWECIIWGDGVLEGPDGEWDCTYSGTGDPMGGNDGLVLDVCAGTGGYDGLTFVAQQAISFSGTSDFGDGTSIHGVLYEGPPPPPFASPASE